MMKMRSVIAGWQVISRLQVNEQDLLSHRCVPASPTPGGDIFAVCLVLRLFMGKHTRFGGVILGHLLVDDTMPLRP
jgi:hypothetical protein